MPEAPARLSNLGYASLASSSVSSSVTISTASQVIETVIVVETNTVRFRDDGTAPTASVGTPLVAGQSMTYHGDPTQMRFIMASAAGTIHFNFYGR